jgi:hypothetical protein
MGDRACGGMAHREGIVRRNSSVTALRDARVRGLRWDKQERRPHVPCRSGEGCLPMTNMAPPTERLRRLRIFTLRPTSRVVKGAHVQNASVIHVSNQEKMSRGSEVGSMGSHEDLILTSGRDGTLPSPAVAGAEFVVRVIAVHERDRLTIHHQVERIWCIAAMWIVQS